MPSILNCSTCVHKCKIIYSTRLPLPSVLCQTKIKDIPTLVNPITTTKSQHLLQKKTLAPDSVHGGIAATEGGAKQDLENVQKPNTKRKQQQKYNALLQCHYEYWIGLEYRRNKVVNLSTICVLYNNVAYWIEER